MVRHFAQALRERSKTDPLDGMGLLEFAARMPFQPWQPPSATVLVAVRQKLLPALFDMFQHHQPYDGSQLYRIPELAPALCPAEAA